MLLSGGSLDGTKILEPDSVEAAYRNQIGELEFPPEIRTAEPPTSADFNAGPGYKFGLGLLLNTADIPGMRKAGSGAWAGLFNTYYWIDPHSNRCGVILMQYLPFFDQEAVGLLGDFEKSVYRELRG